MRQSMLYERRIDVVSVQLRLTDICMIFYVIKAMRLSISSSNSEKKEVTYSFKALSKSCLGCPLSLKFLTVLNSV